MPINTLISALKCWASRTFVDEAELAEATTAKVKSQDETVAPVKTYSPLEYDREDRCNTWWDASITPTYEVGETYVVTFDGTEYTCVCEEYNGRRIIGNPTVLGGYDDGTFNGEEPFVVLENERAFYGGIYDVYKTSCSVGVRRLGDTTVNDLSDAFKEIEKLKLYSPVFTVEFESPNGSDVVCKQTFAEIAEAVESGKSVDARLFIDAYGGQYMLLSLAEYYPGGTMRFFSAMVQEGYAGLQGIELTSNNAASLVGISDIATEDGLNSAISALDSRLSAIESTPNAEGVSF